MGLTISILVFAVGAVLYWAVDATVAGVDVATAGVILMIVGAAGALLSLVVAMTSRRALDSDDVRREGVIDRR